MSRLIINADDFGLTDSCTNAIVDAFNRNFITDTTMMANGAAFEKAAELACGELNGYVGIHFNLTEGVPLTEEILSCPEFCSDGVFHAHISRYKPLDSCAKNAVYTELSAQLKKLKAAGVDVIHADSHHHIHTAPFIAPVVFDICKENGVKAVRLHRNIGLISKYKLLIKKPYNTLLKKQFAATDYFGRLEDADFIVADGVTEIMVHPDYNSDNVLIDRRGEDKTGPALEIITDITTHNDLISYKELL